jgi:hypothetical protein
MVNEILTIAAEYQSQRSWANLIQAHKRGTMSEGENPIRAIEVAAESDTRSLMDQVAAAMLEIEHVKRERSTEEVRAARTHLAALHGVARLRRQAERDSKVA